MENVKEIEKNCNCGGVPVHYPTNFPVQGGTIIHSYEICKRCGGKKQVWKPLDYMWYEKIINTLNELKKEIEDLRKDLRIDGR